MSELLLEVKELVKSFTVGGETLDVLKGIDLKLERSEVLVIVGPSGAGKSTLLQIMGGLSRPSSGTIVLDGGEIYSMSEEAMARLRNTRIGFVFQFHHLLPQFTALENVMMPGLINQDRGKRNALQERASEMLCRLGLEARLKHKPDELSGGEQQRVAVARALINEPDILLADEPTGNLDMPSAQPIHEIFKEMNRTRGQTIVMVTHNAELASQGSRTVRMVDGRIL